MKHPLTIQIEALRAGAEALELRADTWRAGGRDNYAQEQEALCESFAQILRDTAEEICANLLGDPNPGYSVRVNPHTEQ